MYGDDETLEESCWRALTFEHGNSHDVNTPLPFITAIAVPWLEMIRLPKYIDLLAYQDVSPAEVAALFIHENPISSWRPSLNATDQELRVSIVSHSGEVGRQAANFDLYALSMTRGAWGRSFFLSERGYLGWVPKHAKRCDCICVFQGSLIPWVIRPREEGDRLKFIGTCYMQGLMNSEAFELAGCEAESIKLA